MTDRTSPVTETAIEHYASEWKRQIINAGGDEALALRIITLADVNGLFDHLGHAQTPTTADAEREWKRLNAVFHKALEEYPYSHHALHYLWNNAIASPGGTTSDTSTDRSSK